MDLKLIPHIKEECHRIEEDSLYSSKSHYNTASCWEKRNLWIGIPTTVLAAIAGISALESYTWFTVGTSVLVAVLSALNTFLNPSEKANQHKASASAYNTLKNNVRVFREIELLKENITTDEISEQLKNYSDTRNQLNSTSPSIPLWAYKKTQEDINNNYATYKVDKEKQ
ncbi:SLATT domain-containing protein [Serratia liquefaciens]|uniref:SLATT domain-containing protein n=1 Tax=Serratia liquefaciens TaxID=614 RepID=UPI0021776DE9|nr:SLATT domain-containing protein [Serratia liquefaciens]CAI1685198.1 Uncharacterised protein [Serratia liquefaciens]